VRGVLGDDAGVVAEKAARSATRVKRSKRTAGSTGGVYWKRSVAGK